ncbi:DUF5060 domain-containing protein [uncultured Draconibacterium sp.]|uniref:DUF5060 domain-containing protein n=1 Tax=uncultured Draconibacterium sp. TaxID=1573823 RepID=UPI0029C6E7B3|nr:DUF5060 domain-containing protein [uncultured Draconibacterium sp.]
MKQKKINSFILLISFNIISLVGAAQKIQTFTNYVAEWEYVSEKTYQNPFRDVILKAVISDKERGAEKEILAFWDGGNVWKFRYASPNPGTYTFITECNDQSNTKLHQRKGEIVIEKYRGENPVYKHGAIKVSNEGNFLEHFDGTPFFWLADSWWHGMTTRFAFPGDFEKLAGDRKEKGFSVIQFAVSFPCDIEPFDQRGQNEAGDPWDKEFRSINPEYFKRTDLRIQKLLDMGFVPNIVGLWGYYMKWMGVENVSKHWEYLIARYGAFPVTYTLSGETTLAYYSDLGDDWDYYKHRFRTQWSNVAKFIQENDPYDRLLTTHPGPGLHDGKNPIYEMQFLDMVMLQSGHKGFLTLPTSNRFINEYRKRFPNKPVLHGEVCFEGMFGSSWQDVQRILFWSNVLQGTPGFSYGAEGIWQFNTATQFFGKSPTGATWGNVPWQIAMHYKGSEQIGIGAAFLRQLPWWTLKPSAGRVSYHAGVDNYYDPYAAEIKDGLLIYFTKVGFKGNQLKVLGLKSGQKYSYVYFDPITGEQHLSKEFTSDKKGEWLIGTPPVMQDWVLWIRSID